MLGFPEYMSALDDELHNKFLGVFLDSTGGMLDRQDPHQSVDPYIDQETYDKAYDAFIDALEERYNAISAGMSGGRMAQLQRWRSSLDLPLRTEEELFVSALASNNKAAFIALQCESRVSFQNLCETRSDLVSNYDEHLCASLNPARELGPRLVLKAFGWSSVAFHQLGLYLTAPLVGATLGGLFVDKFLYSNSTPTGIDKNESQPSGETGYKKGEFSKKYL